MTDREKTLDEVHARLSYQPLGRFWGKLEIFFGLGAAGLGMLVGGWAVSRPAVNLTWAGAGLVLFVLGWYLALAGHRSHLYRSLNNETALLVDEIRRGRDESRPQTPESNPSGITRDEHPR
jgi:hypothetical protein